MTHCEKQVVFLINNAQCLVPANGRRFLSWTGRGNPDPTSRSDALDPIDTMRKDPFLFSETCLIHLADATPPEAVCEWSERKSANRLSTI